MSIQNGIPRRRLLKTATAAGLAGYAYLHAGAPALAQKVSRLKVGLNPPDGEVTLPFLTVDDGSGPLQPMFECLTMSDRFTGAVGPMLAKEWQSSADAKDWHFTLRSDVVFHDGTPFTAKDVVQSWQLLTAPNSRATTASTFRMLIASADRIEVVNDHELVFHLQKSEPELPYYLTQGFFIYSKNYWDAGGQAGYAAKPIGTGPFKFVEFKAGQYILYDRVANHWRATPEFAELQLLYIAEDVTRLAALLAGEIHIAEIARSEQNQALARGMKIVPSTRPAAIISAKFGGNYLVPKPGPLTNKLVRQALNMAVNRDEINQQIFNGRGTVAVVEGFQTTDPEYDPAWKPYPFDPGQAKTLLAQAGYPNGFSFDMTVVSPQGFPEVPTVVDAMGVYFTNIGLHPNLVPMEESVQTTHQRSKDFFNTVFTNRQNIKPLFQAVQYFWSKGIYHFFEDPYLEASIERFSTSIDPQERDTIIKDIGNFLYNSYASMPLLYVNQEVAVNPSVVAEYKADMSQYGASVGLEYAKAAKS